MKALVPAVAGLAAGAALALSPEPAAAVDLQHADRWMAKRFERGVHPAARPARAQARAGEKRQAARGGTREPRRDSRLAAAR